MKTALLTILVFLLTGSLAGAQIAINEVMASNSSTIEDEDGDYEDWIELYNYSADDVNLLDYGLSDDYDRPFRWVFPDITIQPGEFLLIWASGKDRAQPGNELHTNFAISSAGEEITLTHPDGTLIDEMEPTEIPTDISYGRYPDGTGPFVYFSSPTPGAPNQDDGYQDLLETPEFLIQPGFYPNAIEVEITHSDPDVMIYFTTDGSEPDENAQIYQEPILLDYISDQENQHSMIQTNPDEAQQRFFPWIAPDVLLDKAHTIRAVAVKTGYIPSIAATGTWFIQNLDSHLPVLSLVTEYDNFFDHEIGIYVPGAVYEELGWNFSNPWGSPGGNYFMRGEEWERPLSLEWFENGSRIFQQDIGVRIHGGGTRTLPMKSLRLYARNRYGNTHIMHQVFEDQNYSAYKRLLLRNSGQDFYNKAVMFRDGFMQTLVSGLNFETQAYRPSIVYLNGEFWGLHNIRERYDKHYIERVFGVEEAYLDLLSHNAEPKEGSNENYLALIDFLESNSLSESENYETVAEWVDIENYTDYVIANVFIRNNDWPSNNIDFWRYNGPIDASVPEKDGRWRWLMFDTDFGFGLNQGYNSWQFDMIQLITDEESQNWPNPQWSTRIIRSLLQNDDYQIKFLQRFSDLLNTRFRAEPTTQLINDMAATIEPEMIRHIERWGYPPSMEQWQSNIDLMREFAQLRPAYQWSHLMDYFDIDSLLELEISIEGNGLNYVQMNTVKLGASAEFSGGTPFQFFYLSGVPVRLSAEAYPGFEVYEWRVNGEPVDDVTGDLTIYPEENLQIQVVVVESDEYFSDTVPEAFVLAGEQEYSFSYWSSAEPAGSYPQNMAFVYMDEIEPGIDAQIQGFTDGAYDLESRTRINGLGENGFSFINTSNLDGNPGYPGRSLGGAILALDTREVDDVFIGWTGGTVLPNSREYHLRLQYRIGDEGEFIDLHLPNGSIAEYKRNEEAGHSETIGPVILPGEAIGMPYVQLLWRYYHTGVRHDEDNGQRSQMRVGHITVTTDEDTDITPPERPEKVSLKQNYPNPFNPVTLLPFRVDESMHVKMEVFSITGRKVATVANDVFPAGSHLIQFDGSNLSSGVYIYTMSAGNYFESRKMILLK